MTDTATLAPADSVEVLIVDDHPVYRSGLRALIDAVPHLRVVGEAGSGAAALKECDRLRPHVVLMDVHMPAMTGIEATTLIHGRFPDIAVIVVTMSDDRDIFMTAVRAGAKGYLLKGSSVDDITRAIDTVRAGGLQFDQQAGTWVIEHLVAPPNTGKPFPELTDRERAVLELVADGRGNANIARELGLSIKTVRNYLSRIFTKLQLADRTEAAVLARRQGLGS